MVPKDFIVRGEGILRVTSAGAAGQEVGLRAGVVGAEYGLLVDLLLEAEAEADVLRTAPAIVGVGEDRPPPGLQYCVPLQLKSFRWSLLYAV